MDMTSLATFWATVGLVLFLALIVYLKVPGMMAKSLDERAGKITRELAELYGGALDLSGSALGGLHVSLRLPLARD